MSNEYITPEQISKRRAEVHRMNRISRKLRNVRRCLPTILASLLLPCLLICMMQFLWISENVGKSNAILQKMKMSINLDDDSPGGHICNSNSNQSTGSGLQKTNNSSELEVDYEYYFHMAKEKFAQCEKYKQELFDQVLDLQQKQEETENSTAAFTFESHYNLKTLAPKIKIRDDEKWTNTEYGVKIKHFRSLIFSQSEHEKKFKSVSQIFSENYENRKPLLLNGSNGQVTIELDGEGVTLRALAIQSILSIHEEITSQEQRTTYNQDCEIDTINIIGLKINRNRVVNQKMSSFSTASFTEDLIQVQTLYMDESQFVKVENGYLQTKYFLVSQQKQINMIDYEIVYLLKQGIIMKIFDFRDLSFSTKTKATKTTLAFIRQNQCIDIYKP